MRAVAVLSVLVYHGFPAWFPGGFVGVDVFFVISGFLISGIILTSLRNGTFTFADFYARRIRRIFPALFIVLTASLVAGWFILFPEISRSSPCTSLQEPGSCRTSCSGASRAISTGPRS